MGLFTRADAEPTEPARYDGVAGLESADPVELAATVFLSVFTVGPSKHFNPADVLRALQRLCGIDEVPPEAIRRILAKPGDRYSLDPLYLQCVLLWERALLAARLSRGGEARHHLVLLPEGSRALADPEAESALRRLMAL